MPTPEETRRLREKITQHEAQRHEPYGTGADLLGKFYRSRPVQWALEYPRMGASEGIQKYLEAQETFEDKGKLAGWGHIGRELLQSGTPDIGGLQDWVDPSRGTEIGSRVDLAMQDLEKREGRRPTLTEQYDIMAGIQDEAAPWLTERNQVGPLNFSNRMFIEGPAIAGGVAAEVALTGGTAAAARGAAAIAGRAATQTGAKAMATRAGMNAASKVLAVPMQVDKAMGSVLVAPFKAFGGGVKLSISGTKIVANRMRGRAVDQFGNSPGFNKSEVDRAATEWGTQAAVTEPGRQLGRQLNFVDFIDEKIDGPYGRISDAELDHSVDTNRMNILAAKETPDPQMQKALRDAVREQRRRLGQLTDDELTERYGLYQEKYESVGLAKATDEKSKLLLENYQEYLRDISNEQFNRSSRSVINRNSFGLHMPEGPEKITNNLLRKGMILVQEGVGDILGKIPQLRNPDNFLYKGLRKFGPPRMYDPAKTPEAKAAYDQGDRIAKSWGVAEDVIQNAKETRKTMAMASARHILRVLVDNGVLEYNVGNSLTKAGANQFDTDPTVFLESGELLSTMLKGSENRGNYVLSRNLLESGETFTSRTLGGRDMGSGVQVSKWYKGKKSQRFNPTLNKYEFIGDNLAPGFADVAERQDLYTALLKAKQITVKGGYVGNTYMSERVTTADDLIREVADIAKQYEDIGVRLGKTQREAPGVHYFIDEATGENMGAAYFPRGPVGAVRDGMLTKQEIGLRMEDWTGNIGWGTTSSHHRAVLSQAEGMANGQFYLAPDEALGSQIEQILDLERDELLGTFIEKMARRFGQRFGTIDDLMGETRSPFLRELERTRKEIERLNRKIASREGRKDVLEARQAAVRSRETEIERGLFPDRVVKQAEAAIERNRKNLKMPKSLLNRLRDSADSPLTYQDPKNNLITHTPKFDSDIDRALFVLSSRARKVINKADSAARALARGPVRLASSLSGGGTFQAGLREGSFASVYADEFDPEIINAFNRAFNTNYTPGDIADDASLRSLIASGAEHYHASPVCKNFTPAKRGVGNADANDLKVAQAVVRNIREVKPNTVSVENVPRYKDTIFYEMITDQLEASGYKWDYVIVNAADYGGAQERTRLIIRATRTGELPPLPAKAEGQDWYTVLEDLISEEQAVPIARAFTGKTPGSPNDEISRIMNMLARPEGDPLRLVSDRPIITMGGSASKGIPSARNAGMPAPTLSATDKAVPRIILPGANGLADATVVRVTPRMMARLMGLPDSYVIPESIPLAKTILGNGIHGKVTENFLQPLVDLSPGMRPKTAPSTARVAAQLDTDLLKWLQDMFPDASVGDLRAAGNVVRASLRNRLAEISKIKLRDVPRVRRNNSSREFTTADLNQPIGKETAAVLYPDVAIPRTTAADSLIASKSTRAVMQDAMNNLELSVKLGPSLTPDAGDIKNIVNAELVKIARVMGRLTDSVTEIRKTGEASREELAGLQSHLKKLETSYEEYASDIKRGMEELAGVGLEGHYFPTQFNNAIVKELKTFAPVSQRDSLSRAFLLTNSAMRMMGATGDMSAIGIQGSAVIFNDATKVLMPDGTYGLGLNQTGSSWTAMRSAFSSFSNDGADIVAEYFWRRKQIAIQEGMLTPEDMANAGLAILENAPDLFVSQKWFRIPGTRKFDRAFTHMGNAMRHAIMDSELKTRMATTGMTAQELLMNGEAAQIAAHANFITGIGKRGFAGNLGQLVFFAPRFMHGRWKTVSNAALGMLPGERALQQKLARQYMTRYIGMASMMTFAINDATGHKTDINPFLFNRTTGTWMFNPNFMRIHVGELDISLFGPWDSFLRIMTVPGFMLANGLGPSDYTMGDAFKDIRRTISAPVSGLSIDYLFGEDAMGRSTTQEYDEETGEWKYSWARTTTTALEHLVPFAWDEVATSEPGRPSIISRMTEGIDWQGGPMMGPSIRHSDPGAVATGVAQIGLQAAGAKSTYESTGETLDKVFAEILALGPDDPRLRDEFGVGPENGNRMTEAEYEAWWGNAGKQWWQNIIDVDWGEDFDLEVGFGGSFTDDIPPWSRVAADIQKNIKRRISEGGFSEVMTIEEMEDLEKRINERLEASGNEYSRYATAKKKLGEEEYEKLQQQEAIFIAGGAQDFEGYIAKVKTIRGFYAGERRDLIKPGGPFSGIPEIFEYANKTSLGDVSTFDAHIFDTASSMYYDFLYKETVLPNGVRLPPIVDDVGEVDWDLRDTKLQLWHEKMREQFPDIPEDRIARYRIRVEQNGRREVPPVAGLAMQAQDFLSNTKLGPAGETYYELTNTAVTNAAGKAGQSPENAKKLYRKLTEAGSVAASEILRANPWMRNVYTQAEAAQLRIIRNHTEGERLEGILALMKGTKTRSLYHIRSKHIHNILQNQARGTKVIGNYHQFVADVLNGGSIDEYR